MRNGDYILEVAPEEYTGKKYRGRYAYAHHLAWWRSRGEIVPLGMVIHHINGDKTDNRPANLELLERSVHTHHHAEARDASEQVVCPHCGKTFSLLKSVIKTRLKQSLSGSLFCSRSCGASRPSERALRHGSRTTYSYHRCRCLECKEANTRHQKERREKRSEEATAGS